MTETSAGIPAGWYPDPDPVGRAAGRSRYYDGTGWGELTRDIEEVLASSADAALQDAPDVPLGELLPAHETSHDAVVHPPAPGQAGSPAEADSPAERTDSPGSGGVAADDTAADDTAAEGAATDGTPAGAPEAAPLTDDAPVEGTGAQTSQGLVDPDAQPAHVPALAAEDTAPSEVLPTPPSDPAEVAALGGTPVPDDLDTTEHEAQLSELGRQQLASAPFVLDPEDATPLPPPRPQTLIEAPAPRRRSRGVLIALLVLALLGAGGVGVERAHVLPAALQVGP